MDSIGGIYGAIVFEDIGTRDVGCYCLVFFSITGTACGEEAPGWGLKMLKNNRETLMN